MRSFEEYWNEHGDVYAMEIAENAWDYQQSKIDELQKRVDDLTQVVEELLEEMKYPTATFEEVICCVVKELDRVLKGGLND